MGANRGPTRLLMGSGHSEKDRGEVWGVPCSRLPNREDRGVAMGADSGEDERRRASQHSEIWIEDFCYALTLWWEVRPVLKTRLAGKRRLKTATAGEVGGESHALASKRVMEEGGVTRLEALPSSVDGTWGQTCGSGQPVELHLGGPLVTDLAQSPWSSDLAPGSSRPVPAGLEAGSSCSGSSGSLPRKDSGWAKAKEPLVVTGLECQGPLLPGAKGLAPSSEARPLVLTGPCLLDGPNSGISSLWMNDDLSKQVEEEPRSVENSKIDGALLKEALRYGTASNPFGLLVPVPSSSPSSISGRTPLEEYYNFSRAGWEITQRETQCCIVNGPESTKQRTITSWELMEVNNGSNRECGD